MRQEEKDKLKKYGKLFCDFANAKTTDDILTSFFSNVQSVFNFSSDFTEKALKLCQTKKALIDFLTDNEKQLVKLFSEYDRLIIATQIKDEPGYYDKDDNEYIICEDYVHKISMEYDFNKSMFILTVLRTDFFRDDDFLPAERVREIPEDKLEEYFFSKAFYKEYLTAEFKENIKELIRVCKRIKELKSQITKPFEEIENIAIDYKNTSNIHELIYDNQIEFRDILLQIIKSAEAYKTKEFGNILFKYNRIHKKMTILDESNNTLIEDTAFVERDFFKVTSIIIGEMGIFNSIISYCLIEYLKHPEYQGRERLTVCQKCNDIFIKSKFYDYQFFCPSCSRKNRMTPEERASYMRGYRANPIVKKRERKR